MYYQPSKLYEGNILHPEREKEIADPRLPEEYFDVTPILRGASYFRPAVLDGDTVIVTAYQVPTAEAEYNVIKSAFGLYNPGKKEWVYKDRMLLEPQRSGVVDWCPVIYEGKIYWNANRNIICNDLRTGREIWRKAFRQDFLFTPLIIAENRVIANNEDTWLYALDVNTGAELWKSPSAGTSSHLVYLEGYVYYIGGGDGLLHAVDISNGKTLWKLRSPDLKGDSRAHFFGGISGAPAKNGKKGRVMASTGRHVYCMKRYAKKSRPPERGGLTTFKERVI
ncbi:Outer membrane protein assembly factor BamB [compost metagenome]